MHKAYALVLALGAGLLIGFLRVRDDVLEQVGFVGKLRNRGPPQRPQRREKNHPPW